MSDSNIYWTEPSHFQKGEHHVHGTPGMHHLLLVQSDCRHIKLLVYHILTHARNVFKQHLVRFKARQFY